jgi:hypothetical protein
MLYIEVMRMATQAQTRATTKYIKNHTRQYVVRFHNEREADMIEWLAETGNVTQTIKRLIREEMDREKAEEL